MFETKKQLYKHRIDKHGYKATPKKSAASDKDKPPDQDNTPTKEWNLIQCSECSWVFETPKQLKKHKKQDHGHGSRLNKSNSDESGADSDSGAETHDSEPDLEFYKPLQEEVHASSSAGKAGSSHSKPSDNKGPTPNKAKHSKKGTFFCLRCSRTFEFQTDLQRHLHEHDCLEHKCPTCPALYETLIELKEEHKCPRVEQLGASSTSTASNSTPISAPKSKKKSLGNMLGINKNTPKKVGKSDEDSTKCKKCSRTFDTAMDLFTHIRIHDSLKIRCTICPAMFENEAALHKHKDKAHGQKTGSQNKSYVTSVTPKKSTPMKRSFSVIGTSSVKKFSPPKSSKVTPGKSPAIFKKSKISGKKTPKSTPLKPKISEGLKSVDSEGSGKVKQGMRNYFQCPLCNRLLNSEPLRDEHVAIHDTLQYRCDTCGNMFEKHDQLKGHIFRVHTEETVITPISGKRQAEIDALVKEAQNNFKKGTVKKSFMFRCKECDRVLGTETLFRQHMMDHFNGLLIHTCEFCGHMFAKMNDFSCHRSRKHPVGSRDKSTPKINDFVKKAKTTPKSKGKKTSSASATPLSLNSSATKSKQGMIVKKSLMSKLSLNSPTNNDSEMTPKKKKKKSSAFAISMIRSDRSMDETPTSQEESADQSLLVEFLGPDDTGDGASSIGDVSLSTTSPRPSIIVHTNAQGTTVSPPGITTSTPKAQKTKSSTQVSTASSSTSIPTDIAPESTPMPTGTETPVSHLNTTEPREDLECLFCGATFASIKKLEDHTNAFHASPESQSEATKTAAPSSQSSPPESSSQSTPKQTASQNDKKKSGSSTEKGKKQKSISEFLKSAPKKKASHTTPTATSTGTERECNYCGRILKNQIHLDEHMADHDADKLAFTCDCGWKFSDKKKFDTHKESHKKSNGSTPQKDATKETAPLKSPVKSPLKFTEACQQCGRRFRSKIPLQMHMASHEYLAYTCEVDGWKFGTEKELKQHKHSCHRGVTQKQRDRPQRAQWIKAVESRSRRSACHLCGRFLFNNEFLAAHLKDHERDNLPFTCSIFNCGWKFSKSMDLTMHKARRHRDKRKFLNSLDFKIHRPKKQHEQSVTDRKPLKKKKRGPKGVPCQQCGRILKNSSYLDIHRVDHEKENLPFICRVGQCGWQFSKSLELVMHKANRHPIIPRGPHGKPRKMTKVWQSPTALPFRIGMISKTGFLKKNRIIEQGSEDGFDDFTAGNIKLERDSSFDNSREDYEENDHFDDYESDDGFNQQKIKRERSPKFKKFAPPRSQVAKRGRGRPVIGPKLKAHSSRKMRKVNKGQRVMAGKGSLDCYLCGRTLQTGKGHNKNLQ